MNITQPVSSERLSIKMESHLLCKAGTAKMYLKKHVAFLFCSPVDLVCRGGGEPRLVFCCPFKFKIQSVSPQQ